MTAPHDWLHHYQDEADAAFLYGVLEAAEHDPARREVYSRLAGVERRHTDLWARLLREHGHDAPPPRPSFQARLMAWLGRRLGPGYLLPMLLREEGREVKGYIDLHRRSAAGAARDVSLTLARESAEHAGTLAQLTGAEWGIVTAGCAAAETLATCACPAGADPERIQRLPNLEGMKDEVVIPRHSRNVYDHAVRMVGVRILEPATLDELEAMLGPRTAMIYVLASPADTGPFGLEPIAKVARTRGVPVFVDAAAENLTPEVHLRRGADLVLSKNFGILGMVNIAPYVSWSFIFVAATSRAVPSVPMRSSAPPDTPRSALSASSDRRTRSGAIPA